MARYFHDHSPYNSSLLKANDRRHTMQSKRFYSGWYDLISTDTTLLTSNYKPLSGTFGGNLARYYTFKMLEKKISDSWIVQGILWNYRSLLSSDSKSKQFMSKNSETFFLNYLVGFS